MCWCVVDSCQLMSLSDLLIVGFWRADEARQTLAQEFATLGSSVDMELRQRITTIHDNDAALDKQSKALRNRANALTKTTRQFGGIADSARIKMKVCVSLPEIPTPSGYLLFVGRLMGMRGSRRLETYRIGQR